jgi:hypothetical protein
VCKSIMGGAELVCIEALIENVLVGRKRGGLPRQGGRISQLAEASYWLELGEAGAG